MMYFTVHNEVEIAKENEVKIGITQELSTALKLGDSLLCQASVLPLLLALILAGVAPLPQV